MLEYKLAVNLQIFSKTDSSLYNIFIIALIGARDLLILVAV